MGKKKKIKWFAMLIVLTTVISFIGCPSRQEGKPARLKAFDFSLRTLEGEEIRLSDYQGKKIVHLVFWATWCPACLMEMPRITKLYHSLGNKPYEILAINVGLNESMRRIRQFQEQYQIPFKILLDERGEISQKYGVMGVPTHIIIDREGRVKERFNQLPEDQQRYLSHLLSTS